MIGKLHTYKDSKVFACCDKELLKRKIVSNDLEVDISTDFFGEKEILKTDIINYLNECDSANIFGKKVCDFLLSKNLITKDQIIFIGEIPHIQIYKI